MIIRKIERSHWKDRKKLGEEVGAKVRKIRSQSHYRHQSGSGWEGSIITANIDLRIINRPGVAGAVL